MEKRFFVALFFSLIVIAISQLLFPPPKPNPSSQGVVGNDSISGLKGAASSTEVLATQLPEGQPPGTANTLGGLGGAATPISKTPAAETTVVTTPKAIYKFSNV